MLGEKLTLFRGENGQARLRKGLVWVGHARGVQDPTGPTPPSQPSGARPARRLPPPRRPPAQGLGVQGERGCRGSGRARRGPPHRRGKGAVPGPTKPSCTTTPTTPPPTTPHSSLRWTATTASSARTTAGRLTPMACCAMCPPPCTTASGRARPWWRPTRLPTTRASGPPPGMPYATRQRRWPYARHRANHRGKSPRHDRRQLPLSARPCRASPCPSWPTPRGRRCTGRSSSHATTGECSKTPSTWWEREMTLGLEGSRVQGLGRGVEDSGQCIEAAWPANLDPSPPTHFFFYRPTSTTCTTIRLATRRAAAVKGAQPSLCSALAPRRLPY